jgi:chromosome partitioning protein
MEYGKIQCQLLSAFGKMFSELLSWFPQLGDREIRRPNVTARVVTIANNKGGTGKTTTAVNLASGLAFRKNKRVLLIDFDPQGNASISLDVDIEALKYSVRDLLLGKILDFKYLVWDKGENLQILPANNSLREIEADLVGSVDGRLRLQARLAPVLHDYDFIIIDTPPTLGVFTQAPLIASTEVLIPVDVGYFSLQGIRQILEDIDKIRAHYNRTLEIGGILLTKFDSRTILSKQVEETLRRSFREKAFKTTIKVNVDLVRSQINRKSIFAFDEQSTGARDYSNLIDEVLGNVVQLPIRRAVVAKT